VTRRYAPTMPHGVVARNVMIHPSLHCKLKLLSHTAICRLSDVRERAFLFPRASCFCDKFHPYLSVAIK
jgi:hypothetical protein